MLSKHVTSVLPLGTRAVGSLYQRVLSSSSAPSKAKDPEPVPISKLYDNFLDGTSSTYLEELERRFQTDPSSVDKTWASFFSMASTLPTLSRVTDDTLALTEFVTLMFQVSMYTCRPWDPARTDIRVLSQLSKWTGKPGIPLAPCCSVSLEPDHSRVHAPSPAHPGVPGGRWHLAMSHRISNCSCLGNKNPVFCCLLKKLNIILTRKELLVTVPCIHVTLVQVNGHFAANLDPLGLWDRGQIPQVLDPALYGFKEEDMDRECASHIP